MKKLTPKQEAFCQSVADGKTYSDAYRLSYNTEKMKAESVNRKAYELIENGNISARIEVLKKELADKCLWSREQSISALVSVINYPDKQADVISAVKELNSMLGFDAPKQFEQLGPNGKPIGPMPTKIEIVGVSAISTDQDS